MALALLDDVLSRQPANTLYHYTTQAGLLGIIKKREIWATHTGYLNDAGEYRHAVDVVTAVVTRRLADAIGDGRRVLADMAEGVKIAGSMNVCVCSFSEDRDSLSQWRAYSGPTSGFAIGFNPLHLTEVVRQAEFYLAPCLYMPADKIAVMEALVDRVFDQNMLRLQNGERLVSENGGEWQNIIFPQGGSLVAYLHRYAPILKDKSFSDEKEWRMISRPIPCTSERFDYRCGTSMLIPHYRVPIDLSDRPLKLDEVVVGPTPHIEDSAVAVSGFLVSQRLENVPVKPSAVPYRNW